MASSLVGGVNGPSLCMGIGLSAVPDTEGLNFAAQGIHMAEARKQREAAAKQKEDSDWEKYAQNIKVSGDIDPMYQNQVKENTAKLISGIAEEHSKNPHDHPLNNSALGERKSNWETDMSVVHNNTAAIKQVDALRPQLMASGKYELNKENLKIWDDARSTNNPSLLEKMKDADGNSVVNGGAINASTLASALYKEKPFDWQDALQKSNVKPIIVEMGYQSPSGQYIATSDNKLVDVAASKAQLGTMVDNPTNVVGQEALKAANGNRDKAIDNMFASYGYKVQESTKQGLKTSGQGLTDEQYKQGAGSVQLYPVQNEDGQDVGSVKANGVFTTAPVKVVAAKSTETVDNRTMRSAQGSGEINGTMSEVRILPTSKNTGLPLKTEEYNKLIAEGKASQIVYSPFATIKSDEKREVFNAAQYNKAMAAYDETPDEEKGDKPTKAEYTKDVSDEHGYSKPLKDVAGSFGKKLDVKKVEEDAKRKTEELHSQNKSKVKKVEITKSDLEKKAKDAGYSYDEYYKLVKDKVNIK